MTSYADENKRVAKNFAKAFGVLFVSIGAMVAASTGIVWLLDTGPGLGVVAFIAYVALVGAAGYAVAREAVRRGRG